MRRATSLALALTLGIALAAPEGRSGAQQPSMVRREVLRAGLAGRDASEAHMWVADIAPGAATGPHHHPTPRFVYVLEGAVTLEVEGQPPRTFAVGEGFQELPDVVHNFS